MGIGALFAIEEKLNFIPTVYQEKCARSFVDFYKKNGDMEMAEQFSEMLEFWETIKTKGKQEDDE